MRGEASITIKARSFAPELPIAGVVLNHSRGEAYESAATNAADLAKRCDVPLLATVEFQAQQLPAELDLLALAASLPRSG
jgi:cobyrinic acid a,c-diamide synthase